MKPQTPGKASSPPSCEFVSLTLSSQRHHSGRSGTWPAGLSSPVELGREGAIDREGSSATQPGASSHTSMGCTWPAMSKSRGPCCPGSWRKPPTGSPLTLRASHQWSLKPPDSGSFDPPLAKATTSSLLSQQGLQPSSCLPSPQPGPWFWQALIFYFCKEMKASDSATSTFYCCSNSDLLVLTNREKHP